MVAFFRLFEQPQMLFQRLLCRPRSAINALEHLVLFIAAPVGAGDSGQLEGFDSAGRWHVRAATKIDPIALSI